MKKSYVDYVTEIRMSKAQELLKNTDLPITDIAFEVGYQTHSYFTNLYHKVTALPRGSSAIPRERRRPRRSAGSEPEGRQRAFPTAAVKKTTLAAVSVRSEGRDAGG